MNHNIDIEEFINSKITRRSKSLISDDLVKSHSILDSRLRNKNVLVIGGAGTIGSYYIKAILKFNIRKLVVVDINENGLTELVRDIRSTPGAYVPDEFITYPVNFGDNVFEKIYRHHGPFQIVTNFAAHKHVRSEKDVFSIEAMIENNVFRARKLLDLLIEIPPEHFFCVSTDKAANPVNIMGASKKLMEELIMSYSDRLPVTTARFANVAFSNGSLPLGFLERIKKKQPWSCPIGISRFFVSPQESGELCLMASIMGAPGDIFFPKLDDKTDMIPFDQIAIDLLEAMGLKPDYCKTEEEAKQKARLLNDSSTTYPVYFFGSDTSGEKAYEEFFTDQEHLDLESFINLGVVKNSKTCNLQEIEEIFFSLKQLFSQGNIMKNDIVAILKTYLPNFGHIETGKSLDQKM